MTLMYVQDLPFSWLNILSFFNLLLFAWYSLNSLYYSGCTPLGTSQAQWLLKLTMHQSPEGLGKQIAALFSQSVWFGKLWGDPTNLHFKQIPRWCWCCWSEDNSLRTTALAHQSFNTWALEKTAPHSCSDVNSERNLQIAQGPLVATSW